MAGRPARDYEKGMATPAASPPRSSCAQCGRRLPDAEAEVARWRYGYLAAAGELDETSVKILLCPDCIVDAAQRSYDVGVGD